MICLRPMNIKVIKSDKTEEDFDADKIAKVVEAAGLTENQAQKLAKAIENWAKKQKRGSIPSSTIRLKVYEELKKVDKYSAGLYFWYKKTQEKNPIQSPSDPD